MAASGPRGSHADAAGNICTVLRRWDNAHSSSNRWQPEQLTNTESCRPVGNGPSKSSKSRTKTASVASDMGLCQYCWQQGAPFLSIPGWSPCPPPRRASCDEKRINSLYNINALISFLKYFHVQYRIIEMIQVWPECPPQALSLYPSPNDRRYLMLSCRT